MSTEQLDLDDERFDDDEAGDAFDGEAQNVPLAHLPEADAPSDGPAPLAAIEQLPLALTLRCGELSLPLGQLRRLAPGTVLEVQGVAPGHATLCHGDRVVAEGELVEVDGRLGLQITRMAHHA